MFFRQLPSIKIRGKSPESKRYFNEHHKPDINNLNGNLRKIPVEIMIWAPLDASHPKSVKAAYSQVEKQINRFKAETGDENIRFSKITPRKSKNDIDQLIDGLKIRCHKADLVFVLIADDHFLIGRLITLRKEIPGKLILFINTATKKRFVDHCKRKLIKPFDFEAYFRKNYIFDYPFPPDAKITAAVHCVRLLKFIREREEFSGVGLDEVYSQYRTEVDIFLNGGYPVFLSFLRHLGCATKEKLREHLYISDKDLDVAIDYFLKSEFVKINPDEYALTDIGDFFFDLFDLALLPKIADEEKRKKERQEKLEKEIALFKERWTWPIKGTYEATEKLLFSDKPKLQKLFEDLYFDIARKDRLTKWLMFMARRYFGVDFPEWILVIFKIVFLVYPVQLIIYIVKLLIGTGKKGDNKEKDPQRAIWENELVSKRLFPIWRDSIAGHKQAPWAERREKAAFVEYVYEKLKITYDPKYKDTYINFKNLVFGLKMLRPNPQAHIYLCYSFEMRPLKELIRQYFNISLITGEWDVLLKRYPPYWHIINLWAAPGDRTLLDLRGMDILPFTYRMDFNFNVALELSKVQTSRRRCFFNCPVVIDHEAEAIKEAEVKGLEGKMKGIFKNPSYLTDIDFDEDGTIQYRGGKEGKIEPLPVYGPMRTNYISTRDDLNLVKANPRPGENSGLIIRFNLADPVKVLLNGLDGKRPVSINEVIILWKCMEIAFKPGSNINDLEDVISRVFTEKNSAGLKQVTAGLLNDLEQTITAEGEEAGWRKLMPLLLEGRNKHLVQAICRFLTTDGFEFVFSLWPMIMGGQVNYTYTDKSLEIEEVKAVEKKKNKMPLLDNLKRELEVLLKTTISEYIDFSGGTAAIRSVPMLCGMVVRHCLDTKEGIETDFRKKLKSHLMTHYKKHNKFMHDYLSIPLKTDAETEKEVDGKCDQIITQIDITRNRLLSRGENNRLLRYIDQDSINVQIGRFSYDGKVLKELDLIMNNLGYKSEIEEMEQKKEKEVKAFEIETDKRIEIHHIGLKEKKMHREGAMRAIAVREKQAILEAESQRRILLAQIEQTFTEIENKALESLKEGELRYLAHFALLKSYKEGGESELERILHNSPNLVMAMNPHLHHEQEIDHMKGEIIKIISKAGKGIEPINISMLLEQDPEKIVLSEAYEKFVDKLSTYLEYSRLAPQLRLPVQGGPKDKEGIRNKQDKKLAEQAEAIAEAEIEEIDEKSAE